MLNKVNFSIKYFTQTKEVIVLENIKTKIIFLINRKFMKMYFIIKIFKKMNQPNRIKFIVLKNSKFKI